VSPPPPPLRASPAIPAAATAPEKNNLIEPRIDHQGWIGLERHRAEHNPQIKGTGLGEKEKKIGFDRIRPQEQDRPVPSRNETVVQGVGKRKWWPAAPHGGPEWGRPCPTSPDGGDAECAADRGIVAARKAGAGIVKKTGNPGVAWTGARSLKFLPLSSSVPLLGSWQGGAGAGGND
jgi:hypothetical protein